MEDTVKTLVALDHILEDIFDEFIENNAERIRSIILDDEIDGGDDEDG